MRLIDADVLKENMVRECRNIGEAMGVTMPVLAFTHVIDDAPTIEERPKGKWGDVFHEQVFNYRPCSNCKMEILESAFDNFCPNCGADMRKEDPRESD